MSRQNLSSGGQYEKIVGYSRAVKAGNMVFVSGTTGFLESGDLVSSDEYAQAKRAIQNIDITLRKAGSSLDEIVRTRVFVSPGADWHAIARAHSEFFGMILPASTMVVCSFLDPRIKVEIEADAMIDSNR
jgi:enamine deaminase RidA (YjgF/YER057c/UK114 family)